MTSDDLTCEQARQMGAVVGRQLNYLGRLRTRMERRGFPPNDPLMRDVSEAWKAVHGLSVRLHYLSIPSGVGAPKRHSTTKGE